MKKYIFLTFTLDGVTGGQRYVDSKVRWLLQEGWDVVVFDHRGSLEVNSNVILDNLIPFQHNRFYELFFPPAYFSRRQRKRIVEKMCDIIGLADDYVVESNSDRLSLWGELLSKQLKAKHLIFHIGEHPKIKSLREYEFFSFKFDRNELFMISPRIIKSFFKGYRELTESEASNHVYTAITNLKAQEVPMPELDKLPQADYKILSFGREKPYFDMMIHDLALFVKDHKDKTFIFLLMGIDNLPERFISILNTCQNLYYKTIPLMLVVPRAVFDYSDVVIATAGCAGMSFSCGAKTISINVESNRPMGVMGYSTLDLVDDNKNESNDFSLYSLLSDILIDKKYEGEYVMCPERPKRGYVFQLSLVNDDRAYFQGVEKIVKELGALRYIQVLLLRLNCIGFLIKLFHLRVDNGK